MFDCTFLKSATAGQGDGCAKPAAAADRSKNPAKEQTDRARCNCHMRMLIAAWASAGSHMDSPESKGRTATICADRNQNTDQTILGCFPTARTMSPQRKRNKQMSHPEQIKPMPLPLIRRLLSSANCKPPPALHSTTSRLALCTIPSSSAGRQGISNRVPSDPQGRYRRICCDIAHGTVRDSDCDLCLAPATASAPAGFDTRLV